jgi:two-component system, NtrC family, response regulator AtoC
MKPQRPRYLLTRQMDAFASRAASNTFPKLIDGASGTGKTILASVIHKRSPRSRGPFVTQGCGDFHEGLAGSRFLGHEKGAFTGAHERVPGIFEQANRGTLALNDLDALSMELQTNLLHILDHGQVTRPGGKSPIDVDVQVIVTTNQDPEGLVAAGRLRGDVFSRVSHIRFTCPPLSERDDVPELAQVMLLNLWQRGFLTTGLILYKSTG